MKKINSLILLIAGSFLTVLGSAVMLVLFLRSVYSGKVSHGGVLEMIVVPREMRNVSKLIKLNPSEAFFEAGDLEGFYSVVCIIDRSDENGAWEMIEEVAERNEWSFSGSQRGIWGRTLNFSTDGLTISFILDGNTTKMIVRTKL